jgi:hypothetical protein
MSGLLAVHTRLRRRSSRSTVPLRSCQHLAGTDMGTCIGIRRIRIRRYDILRKNPIHGYVLLFLKYINNTCHNRNILFSPSRPNFFIFSAQPKLAIHIKSRNPNTLLNPLSHQSTPAATAPCSRRHPPQLLSIATALFCSPSTPSPTVAVGSARAVRCRCRIRPS